MIRSYDSRPMAGYSTDGSLLLSTMDAAGKVTAYGYHADTLYRPDSTGAITDQGSALTASYAYTDDMLTEIETGSIAFSS